MKCDCEKEIGIDIVAGQNCNFRCKYCYEKDQYVEEKMSVDTLKASVKFITDLYMHYMKNDGDIRLHLFFFGGEPLLYTDEIMYLVNNLRNVDPDLLVNVTTNGSLIQNNLNFLKKLNSLTKFSINVSYDYCFQDITRMPKTYDLVRNNILSLYDNTDINIRTITTMPINSLYNFDKVVEDYFEMFMDNPYIRHYFQYNVDNSIISDEELILDEDKFINALVKTNDYINKNDLDRERIKCNTNSCLSRSYYVSLQNDMEKLKSPYRGVYCGLNYNGDLYHYGSTIIYRKERDLFKYGNVNDSLETIMKARDKILEDSYNPNKAQELAKCLDCKNQCKVIYWRTLKNNDIKTMNGMPTPTWCRIHDLLREYELC